jgi:miniconductance mechanosensitive channel
MGNLHDRLLAMGLSTELAYLGATVATLLIALLASQLLKALLNALLKRQTNASRPWQEALRQASTVSRAGWVVFFAVISVLGKSLFEDYPDWLALFEKTVYSLLIVLIALSLSSLVSVVVDTLARDDTGERRLPVKAVDQSLQLVIWAYASVTLLSVLTGKDLASVLAGMTAIGAVLVYVFRDSILGWTASIQLAANDAVREGDWISVPRHDADGVVEEIALTTVRVRNWDKTISALPTYGLFSEGFQNWRGMLESGGRRIKRSILIDAESIKFCDEALAEKLSGNAMLKNLGLVPGESQLVSDPLSELCETNLGLFRRWLAAWLREHPQVSENGISMVRELQSTGRGIPVEIYLFSNDQRFVQYESFQADLMDHLHAVLGTFDLRLFQEPGGHSFEHYSANGDKP